MFACNMFECNKFTFNENFKIVYTQDVKNVINLHLIDGKTNLFQGYLSRLEKFLFSLEKLIYQGLDNHYLFG